MPYKYGLINIKYEGLPEDYCELVELYAVSSGSYNSFSKASISSIEDIESAYKDILNDGVNYWFANNGKFYKTNDGFWGWERNVSDEEAELYAIYGGD